MLEVRREETCPGRGRTPDRKAGKKGFTLEMEDFY